MARSICSNWLGLLISVLVGVALTPLMIHRLGLTYYGLWILISSLLDYSGLLDNGIRVAMFRFVARFHGTGDRLNLNRTLTASLALTGGAGLMLLALLPPLVIWLPRLFPTAAREITTFRWTLALVGVSFAIAFSARALGSYLQGIERFDLYNLGAVSTVLLRAGGIVAVLLAGDGLVAVAAVTLAGTLFSLLINAWLVYRTDRAARVGPALFERSTVKELLGYGSHAFVYKCGDQLRSYTDALVIGRVLIVGLIPIFSIATRLTEMTKQFFTAAAGPTLGRLTELDGRGEEAALARYFLDTTRYFWTLGLFVSLMLCLDGRALIVAWVGRAFLPSYRLMMILIAGWTLEYGWAPSQMILLARARHRFLAYLTLGEGAANLVLSILWARHYGLVGVAVGTAVPMLVSRALIQPWYTFRVARVRAFEFARHSLLRPTLALALWLGLCLLPGVPRAQGGVLHLALAMLVQSILFLIIALPLALQPQERRRIAAHYGARWPRHPHVRLEASR